MLDRFYLSRAWFQQAQSDIVTAEALLNGPIPMRNEDVGCHVTAMCAQSVEKSIKGYVLLNNRDFSWDHRPDKYLVNLLTKDDPLLRYKDHYSKLCRIFSPERKASVRKLLDLTPGGLGKGAHTQNTEYPWVVSDISAAPVGADCFADKGTIDAWVKDARHICDGLRALWIAVDRVLSTY